MMLKKKVLVVPVTLVTMRLRMKPIGLNIVMARVQHRRAVTVMRKLEVILVAMRMMRKMMVVKVRKRFLFPPSKSLSD